jgi:hypothetical protein
MARRDILLAGAVLASMAIAACSSTFVAVSPGASPGSVARGDACSLVTGQEVTGILNTDPLSAFQDPSDPATCNYSPAGGTAIAGASVSWLPTGGEKAIKGFADSSSYVPVAGIGDEAYQDGGEIVFRVGDQLFNVHLGAGGPVSEQAVIMAKVMVARATGQPVPAGLIPTPPPVLAAKNPCKLLSADEARTALQIDEVLVATDNDSGASNQPIFCFYNHEIDGVAVMSTFLDPKGGFDNFDATIAGIEVTTVDGLGEKSVFDSFEGKLYTLKGDSILMVNVYTSRLASIEEADRTIMEILLSRLIAPS